MLNFRPSSDSDLVRPVMAVFVPVLRATLLDRSQGGSSSYGQVSFRRMPSSSTSRYRQRPYRTRGSSEDRDMDGLGWLVGIKNTRGSSTSRYSATVMAFGREARAVRSDVQIERAPIGGVFQIDTVLAPYEPSWFYRCKSIVAVSTCLRLILI